MGQEKKERGIIAIDLTQNERLAADNAAKRELLDSINKVEEEVAVTLGKKPTGEAE